MMHQSLTGLSVSKQNSDLAAAVENISERLNSEQGDSMPAIAVQMHQIAERVSKVEEKRWEQKNLIDTLTRENQQLKTNLKLTKRKHDAEIVGLREQITKQMQQLKSQHREEHTEATKPQGSRTDWVHVELPPKVNETPSYSDHSLVDRVRKLELEKAELLRANSSWKSQWDKMEQNHQMRMDELRSRLMDEQEAPALKARLAELNSEFETRMLEMKRRIDEEEGMKDEAQHQHRLAERTISELQNQLSEVKTQLSDAARDKQTLSAELNILKARLTCQETQTHGAAGANDSVSRAALEAEIAMLRQQLNVFAEDFAHEREDRISAQAARDAAKKNLETMAREKLSLSSQIKHLQKQIKDRDDTISWTLRQNETQQRQANDYKKKLASEWEEKQNLKRMLTLAQQQQQQERNPYLTQESSPVYNNSRPLYQPPPTGTSPYYGGTGASPSRNRTAATAVSPEHLPGAWTCMACTYINFPGRTVCESCGLVNNPRTSADQFAYSSHDFFGSEHALLMSRGGDQNQRGAVHTNGDLVTDSASDAVVY